MAVAASTQKIALRRLVPGQKTRSHHHPRCFSAAPAYSSGNSSSSVAAPSTHHGVPHTPGSLSATPAAASAASPAVDVNLQTAEDLFYNFDSDLERGIDPTHASSSSSSAPGTGAPLAKNPRDVEQKLRHVLYQIGAGQQQNPNVAPQKLSLKVYYFQELSLAIQDSPGGPKKSDIFLDSRYQILKEEIIANMSKLSPGQLVSVAASFARLRYQSGNAWNLLADNVEIAVFGKYNMNQMRKGKKGAYANPHRYMCRRHLFFIRHFSIFYSISGCTNLLRLSFENRNPPKQKKKN